MSFILVRATVLALASVFVCACESQSSKATGGGHEKREFFEALSLEDKNQLKKGNGKPLPSVVKMMMDWTENREKAGQPIQGNVGKILDQALEINCRDICEVAEKGKQK